MKDSTPTAWDVVKSLLYIGTLFAALWFGPPFWSRQMVILLSHEPRISALESEAELSPDIPIIGPGHWTFFGLLITMLTIGLWLGPLKSNSMEKRIEALEREVGTK